MVNRRVCIVDGLRTAFAKAGTQLKDVPAHELGRIVTTELLERNDRPGLKVDEVIFGNIIGPPEASNISRVIALHCGLPDTTPAYTLNMNCASGMLSMAQAFDHIKTGQADVVIAGGTESMSNAPLHFPKQMGEFLGHLLRAKTPVARLQTLARIRPSFFKPIITLTLGLTDPVSGLIMGKTAENLARRYHITREEQDQFALRSHQTYFKGWTSGFYQDHLVPIFAPPKYKKWVEQDLGPRDNLTIEQLAKLRPFFERKYGTVTIGNSCPVTDGAAACLIMEESRARQLGFEPEIFIRSTGFRGVPPEIMGVGPAAAAPVALRNAGCTMQDIQLTEINEAFAAQIIANEKIFASSKLYEDLTGDHDSPLKEIPRDQFNVNGGAIALGHPVGTSGCRIVINLFKEMQRRDLNLGLAAICVGGGLGGAMVIERG